MDIIEKINRFLDEEVKAKKEKQSAKQYAKQYYSANSLKIKKKKKRLDKSIEGKKRKRMKPIMAKQRKTPTGRHEVEYNV